MIKPKNVTKLLPTTFTADEALLKRLDDEMLVRRSRNRSGVIRALIEEGLHRAGVRRGKKLPVELGAKGGAGE